MAEKWRGKIGGMNKERTDLYLSGDSLARVAVLDDDGRPYVVPLWYQWDGEAFWFVIRERSAIGRYMRDNHEVALTIDDDVVDDPDRGRHFKLPKVFAQGRAEIIEEPNIGGRWVQVAEEMAVRYFGADGPSYIVPTLEQPRWLIKMVPDNMKTWEGAGWAKRYWVEGEKGPSYEEIHK